MTPLYEIRIRRDAHTVTPVTVPEYDLPQMFERLLASMRAWEKE